MSQVLILLRKSLLSFSRARAATTFTFLVPVVLIFLFGHVFGLYRKDPAPAGIALAVVNASPEPAARQLVEALRAEKTFRLVTDVVNPDGTRRPLTEADARAGLRASEYRFALILPADLFRTEGIGLQMRFLSNPRNEIETQLVYGMLQKTVFSNVPQLLGQSLQAGARRLLGEARYGQFNDSIATAVSEAFGGDRAAIRRQIEAGDFLGLASGSRGTDADQGRDQEGNTTPGGRTRAADLFTRLVAIETEQIAGTEVKNPMAARLVGGYAIMFLLMAVSSSATTLFEEKESGVFQRLLSSPVRPAHIIAARFLFGVIVGLVQLVALFATGRVLFGLEIVDHAPALLLICVSAAAACAAFGIFVAAIAPSAPAASGIATLLVLTMSAIGGAWFPVSFMPAYIQSLSKFTLVYWAVEGMTDVLWAGNSLWQVLPKAGILFGMAAALMGVAGWSFNRRHLFD